VSHVSLLTTADEVIARLNRRQDLMRDGGSMGLARPDTSDVALGQKATSRHVRMASALPQKQVC
jgi:hypothetical protein